ncbi:glycosyltransferase family 4 protein [Actinomadura rupiterrae]|uniref:glycosyltransferase family 4 protein n=1 Tax=Actinomadura rupiterrae TaxID=559627 RepID=UPI0020A4E71B|nr:glycosyltransferase family 4 protein [Actinomadura rupiterrae]MCP2340243.1 glycosyltransferase involved in cell wall biosynthesis [Actinomadura rupiterrae]
MRILHVSDCFPPRLGGIEVQVDELARAQYGTGHEVAVATATPAPAGAGEPTPFPVARLVAPLPWELPIGRSLGPLLDDLKPDVVHVHAGAVSPFAWRAVHSLGITGPPVVLTVHSMWGPVSRTVYRALVPGWARRHGGGLVVTTVSEAAARPIRAVVDGRLPVRVISNGIDLARWHAETPAEGDRRVAPVPLEGDGSAHVVAVGRLAPRKEPVNLLRVLREAASAVPLRATIVGDGPARRRMERYLRRHGMSGWVRLTGRLDRSEVRNVLETADMFLAPASRESFGLAALEARLAGVPVVAQAGGGVADFVTSGREGLLGGTPRELAAALARLASDPALRGRIAAHNRATSPVRCSWPAVLAAFDSCYEAASAKTDFAHL